MNGYSVRAMQSWERLPRKKHVQVDYERLSMHAKSVAEEPFLLPVWDEEGVYPSAHASFPSHCFWHNVVNFCFSYRDPTQNGKLEEFRTIDSLGGERAGSTGMRACFYRIFGEKPIGAPRIRQIAEKPERTRQFFLGHSEIPLIEERRKFLLDASEVISERYRNDPAHILEEGNYRAFGSKSGPGVVDLLVRDFPAVFGSDSTRLGNDSFPFLKRAQLFVLEYHGRAVASGGVLPPIEDIGELGPIVDYEIPRYYHNAEILSYSGPLLEYICNCVPIPSRSPMEIELRGATLYAFYWELVIINQVRAECSLPPIHIGHLDFDRWKRGREITTPHHLCLTTDY